MAEKPTYHLPQTQNDKSIRQNIPTNIITGCLLPHSFFYSYQEQVKWEEDSKANQRPL